MAERLTRSDDVRGDYPTLEQAALEGCWPTLAEARGHIVVPNPNFETDYFAEVPGGYAARCNPLTAPEGCDSELIRP